MKIKQLSFLQTSIAQLHTGLFFCSSQSMLPFSAYLVEALTTDEQGAVWFFISKPAGQVVDTEHSFPVSMEFYRKGQFYTVDIEGIASVMQPKDYPGQLLTIAGHTEGKLLVKVQIEKALYKTFTPTAPFNSLSAIGQLCRDFFQPGIGQWQSVA